MKRFHTDGFFAVKTIIGVDKLAYYNSNILGLLMFNYQYNGCFM